MARILVLCPSHRDHRELGRVANAASHEFVYHDYASIELEEFLSPRSPPHIVRDVVAEVDELVKRHGRTVDGVVSTDDYPGSALASIVAQRLGLPGTSPRANLLCQHKYHSRRLQRQACLEGTPDFELVRHEDELTLALPCFVKPVKSYFSIGASKVCADSDLSAAVRAATLPERFFTPFRKLFENYTGLSFGDGRVLAETLLEGIQCTLEGCVFEGRMEILGVVDSIMFPGTQVFSRFEYPSTLSAEVCSRMARIARGALRAAEFTHGLFNVEFMYDPARDSVHLVEINPRMASQFADLFEKVDGINTYEVLLDVALRKAPRLERRGGKHGFAMSHVLRRFEDARVVAIPSLEHIDEVRRGHPDVRLEILVSPGRRLSHELQDGKSFRYGIINVGASNREEAMAALADCSRRLPFSFSGFQAAMGDG